MSEIFKPWSNKRYENPGGKGYLRVIGYIDKPALLLKNPITGEALTLMENHQFTVDLQLAQPIPAEDHGKTDS